MEAAGSPGGGRINPAIAPHGSPPWCRHPPASPSSPPLGWAGAAPALASPGDSVEPVPLACHPSRTKPASTPNFLLCFAGLLRKLAQNWGTLFPPGQGNDAAPSFSIRAWQRAAQSLASSWMSLSRGKVNLQKICSYLQFFFFAAKISISLQEVSIAA